MMALRLASRVTPMDNTMVTIAGRPSGMAETAREIDTMKISISSMPLARPIAKITAQMMIARTPSIRPSWASFFCRGV